MFKLDLVLLLVAAVAGAWLLVRPSLAFTQGNALRVTPRSRGPTQVTTILSQTARVAKDTFGNAMINTLRVPTRLFGRRPANTAAYFADAGADTPNPCNQTTMTAAANETAGRFHRRR